MTHCLNKKESTVVYDLVETENGFEMKPKRPKEESKSLAGF